MVKTRSTSRGMVTRAAPRACVVCASTHTPTCGVARDAHPRRGREEGEPEAVRCKFLSASDEQGGVREWCACDVAPPGIATQIKQCRAGGCDACVCVSVSVQTGAAEFELSRLPRTLRRAEEVVATAALGCGGGAAPPTQETARGSRPERPATASSHRA